MKRLLPAVLAMIIAAPLTVDPAAAFDNRYQSKPPVRLSQDLTDPWLLQLQPSYRFGPSRQQVVAPEFRHNYESDRDRPQLRTLPSWSALRAERRRESAVRRQVSLTPERNGAAANEPAIVRYEPAPTPAKKKTATRQVDPEFLPTVVDYTGPYSAGTIVIDTNTRHLFLVEAGGTARRYGVGVGRPGFEWAGSHQITRKAEWPDWVPPAEMRQRQPNLPERMEGGPRNPLGARAMYLGSTLYRIHGSNEPWTIGRAVSSGCIRMRNEDVIDLYDRVGVGTKVVVM